MWGDELEVLAAGRVERRVAATVHAVMADGPRLWASTDLGTLCIDESSAEPVDASPGLVPAAEGLMFVDSRGSTAALEHRLEAESSYTVRALSLIHI